MFAPGQLRRQLFPRAPDDAGRAPSSFGPRLSSPAAFVDLAAPATPGGHAAALEAASVQARGLATSADAHGGGRGRSIVEAAREEERARALQDSAHDAAKQVDPLGSLRLPAVEVAMSDDGEGPETVGGEAKAESSAGPPSTSGTSVITCELRLQDRGLVERFGQLNSRLRRNGFREVPHVVEHDDPKEVEHGEGPASVIADAAELWGIWSEVLEAYDRRGKRLRDALLAERSEDRSERDTRIKELLHINARLEAELKPLRSFAASSASIAMTPATPCRASPGRSLAGVDTSTSQHGEALQQELERSRFACTSSGTPARSVNADNRELAEALLRAKAAEALARSRERDLDKLKCRLEQVLADCAKRQEREKQALARPLRRRAGGVAAPAVGSAGARRDESLLEMALAQQSRAEALQVEVASLTKQVHTLSFGLDAAEERCRKMEAERRLVPIVSAARATPAPEASDGCPVAGSPAEVLARERDLRTSAEESLAQQAERHAHEVQEMGRELETAKDRIVQLEADRRSTQRQPSDDTLRWQREALRLRDELMEARRTWRSSDTRSLIKRDKELRRLGLDARAIEEGARKSDLIDIVVELCRTFSICDLSALVPAAADLRRNAEEATRAAEDARQAADQAVAAKLAIEEAARLRRRVPAAASEEEVVPSQVGEDASVTESLASTLRCQVRELPERVASMVRLCDERVAHQRIVQALQKLLHVESSVAGVLPALKEVLDVAALRQRSARVAGVAAAAASVPSST